MGGPWLAIAPPLVAVVVEVHLLGNKSVVVVVVVVGHRRQVWWFFQEVGNCSYLLFFLHNYHHHHHLFVCGDGSESGSDDQMGTPWSDLMYCCLRQLSVFLYTDSISLKFLGPVSYTSQILRTYLIYDLKNTYFQFLNNITHIYYYTLF